MIDLEMATNDNERLALRLLQAMEDGSLMEAMGELCHHDFVWANSGLPTLNGLAAVRQHMASGGFAQKIPILKTMTSFSADVLYLASNGPIVFSERIDHHWDADGRDLMAPHIAGVMEIHHGRVSALRDFYDTVCYQQVPTDPDPLHALP